MKQKIMMTYPKACLKKIFCLNLPWNVLENHYKPLKSPWIIIFATGQCSAIGNVSDWQVWSRPGLILSWRLIMKWFLRPFSSLPLIQEGLLSVTSSYKQKYVHEALVNRLTKCCKVNWPSQHDHSFWLGCKTKMIFSVGLNTVDRDLNQ